MKRTIKNRLLIALLSVATVFAVAFGLSLSNKIKTTYAEPELPALQNVQQDGSVLTWDAFDGAVYYFIEIGNGGTTFNEPTVDLEYMAKYFQVDSGDCQYSIYAMDENHEQLSEYYIGFYYFTNTQIPLDNPTVWWDHSTACWTAVDGVDEYNSYRLYFYEYVDGENDVYLDWDNSSNTYKPVYGLVEGKTYYFEVQARAGDLDHKDSELVRSDLKTMTAEDLEYVYVEKAFTLLPEDIEVAPGENPEPTWAVNFDAVKYEVLRGSYLEATKAENIPAGTEMSTTLATFSVETSKDYVVKVYYGDGANDYIETTFTCTWVEEIASTTLTGTVEIDGAELIEVNTEEGYYRYLQVKCGDTITATLTNTNNSGVLSYYLLYYNKYTGYWYYDDHDETDNTFTFEWWDVGFRYLIDIQSSVESGKRESIEIRCVKADGPDAPFELTTTACTTSDNNDGTISGVNTDMEYKLETAEEWNEITEDTITGLASGTYKVRYAETDTNFAGEEATVVIDAYEAPAPVNPIVPEPKPAEKGGLSVGAIIGIVIAAVVVCGCGGFAIYWFIIKKKTWADFIAIFKKK